MVEDSLASRIEPAHSERPLWYVNVNCYLFPHAIEYCNASSLLAASTYPQNFETAED